MYGLCAEKIAEILVDLEKTKGPGASVLEAGCGRFKHFDYPETMRICGLDISADQLEQNNYAQEKHLGDVQTYKLDSQYDLVVSVFVLEHVADPQAAMANMMLWTKPGGLLILVVPNALSVKGLVTKFTPFWFHHFFYKYVYRRAYSIFPTTMKFCIAPAAMRRFFENHEILHQDWGKETLALPFNFFYTGLMWFLRIVSFGQWRPDRSNYLVIFKKAE